MATKTITITKDAYGLLSAHKNTKESFSDVITKHFKKSSLWDVAGILSHEEAEALRKHVRERRKASRARLNRIAKRLA